MPTPVLNNRRVGKSSLERLRIRKDIGLNAKGTCFAPFSHYMCASVCMSVRRENEGHEGTHSRNQIRCESPVLKGKPQDRQSEGSLQEQQVSGEWIHQTFDIVMLHDAQGETTVFSPCQY